MSQGLAGARPSRLPLNSGRGEQHPRAVQSHNLFRPLRDPVVKLGLRAAEAEKQAPSRRRDGNAVRAAGVGADGVAAGCPTPRRGQIAVLLQGEIGRVRPGDNDAVAGMGDGQVGKPRRLHDGNQTPKAAGQRIIAAAHRAAGVRLADGAADGILAAAGGGAAPALKDLSPEAVSHPASAKNALTAARASGTAANPPTASTPTSPSTPAQAACTPRKTEFFNTIRRYMMEDK